MWFWPIEGSSAYFTSWAIFRMRGHIAGTWCKWNIVCAPGEFSKNTGKLSRQDSMVQCLVLNFKNVVNIKAVTIFDGL